MKTRRRRRKARAHRRRTRRNVTPTIYRANPRKRRRSHRRRRRASLRANPVRRYRRRSRRRGRRNPSVVSRSIRSATYGGKRLFSVSMVKNVLAGVAGFAGVNLLEPFVPFAPASFAGMIIKKGIAGAGVYLAATLVTKNRGQRQYVLYGAAFNIGLDIIRTQLPTLAAQAKLSGFGQYDYDLDAIPAPTRVTPYMATPSLLG